MCVLCSQLWVEDHWSDAATEAAPQANGMVVFETNAARRGSRLRDRSERARAFNLILRSYGLTLQDWEGSSYILRNAKGDSAVVANLAGVWAEANRMFGAPIDPLDPELVARLRNRATSGT